MQRTHWNKKSKLDAQSGHDFGKRGLFIVLQWKHKPKKLGTGFYWGQITSPARYEQIENWIKGKTGSLIIWPANNA